MTTPAEVVELTERFERNREAYRSGRYNETQLRREFIDPFFETLGWDVDNKQGYAEAYKDVIHEDAIKIGGATKAPDYCFRIGGTRKFFLEAKKPSVNIKDDIHPAYQLRRYAWSAKLPLSILTDFEELAVYDCRIRPHRTDKASAGRTFYFTYEQYADRWDELASIFTRDAVLKGSFDKYAESTKRKKGTAEVDVEFLKEIERWRETLAQNFALRNGDLSVRDLNFAVQRTIDRIIFLRMCEDRGVESYGQLQALVNGKAIYARLGELFRRADERYNSSLFYFMPESGREPPDELTLGLRLDDRVLKEMLGSLYYPESPYEFSVLPPEILGNVYEQFLGKVIRLTKGHRAAVEDKPEVKKAGGVYYTPTYIVDYIVKNTLGKLLEGKTPAEVGPDPDKPRRRAKAGSTRSRKRKQVEPLRVLDPACGSGSFLLGAYQYLLDWHRDWYIEDGPDKHRDRLYQASGNQWRLTIQEKKRILLNHIHGVDIDPQAVEVTKLSLLLRVLEGETGETIGQTFQLFHERALPDLNRNIKCGNSLIGPDFYQNQQMTLLDDEERYRINVFDWHAEFPDVFAGDNPGFDAVIGNPPYIGFHGFSEQKRYLRSRFVSAEGKFDYYLPFIEQGLHLLCSAGLLSFICPTNFMKREHGKRLRDHLRNTVNILEICDFQDVQIFKGALNYTAVFVIQNSRPDNLHRVLYKQRSLDDIGFHAEQTSLNNRPWIFRSSEDTRLINKINDQSSSKLGEISVGISEGIVTGHNGVFLLSNQVAAELGLEDELIQQCIRGRQIRRYTLDNVDEVVIYPYQLSGTRTRVIEQETLRDFPRVWDYLCQRRPDLSGRQYFETSSKAWYELWCQRDLRLLGIQKIVVAELAESNRFAIADQNQFYGDTVCGITLKDNIQEHITYILGLLNSALMTFCYKRTTVPKANGYFIYKTMFLKHVPIRRIDFSDGADVSRHDRMVELVQQMLDLHKQLPAAKTAHEKTALQRQINATDGQIDQLVYELYGLTDDEIRIVKDATEQKRG